MRVIADLQDLIRRQIQEHQEFIKAATVSMNYYKNLNDILRVPADRLELELQKQLSRSKNPLRNADNRISHNWHQLLVDQKTSYAFTYAPVFDTGTKKTNKLLSDLLGDDFARYCKDLCIDASNTGRAWLHYWLDPVDNSFQYAPVPAIQVAPIYDNSLKSTLLAVIRCYQLIDEAGVQWERFEYWTAQELRYFRRQSGVLESEIEAVQLQFTSADGITQVAEVIAHPFGVVPFIEFPNNRDRSSDLDKYKGLIDLYDKIISGFGNDLEDIQEVIFLLKNYGREPLSEMLQNLKLFKAVKLDDGEGGSGGLETLTIDIPVEARKVALDILRRQIFVSGQGVDPDPERFGNASGVALKFLYSLLEMKVGLMETEFRSGFNDLVRAVLKHVGIALKKPIIHLYTRAAINNELENAQVGKMLTGILSEQTILESLFWVDDPEREAERLAEERKAQSIFDPYGQFTPKTPDQTKAADEADDATAEP